LLLINIFEFENQLPVDALYYQKVSS